MNALTDLLEMDIAAWIVGAFLIMAGINKGIEILGNFSKSIGKPFKWVKKRDADHNELEKAKGRIDDLETKHKDDTKTLHQEIKESIDDLKKQMKEYSDNRVSDRKQSFAIQKELTEAQRKISESVDKISEKVDALKKDTDERFERSEAKQDRKVQAEIKETIGQIYRRCHASGQIERIDLGTLKDLIKTYEEHGGENSFVHSLVEKEMYTWEVIEN